MLTIIAAVLLVLFAVVLAIALYRRTLQVEDDVELGPQNDEAPH